MNQALPHSHEYVVKSGDTPYSIAQSQYGHATKHYARKIMSANSVTGLHPLKPGDRIVIPV